MRLAESFAAWLFDRMLAHVAMQRAPDFVIGAGNPQGAYLNRWYLTPWRGWYRDVKEQNRTRWMRFAIFISHCLPNLYLHEFLRDDDDRALHDHPAWSLSFMLHGTYMEHTIAAGGVHRRERIDAGTLRFRWAKHAHRIELLKEPSAVSATHFYTQRCWTLFAFGPVITGRGWGFHCERDGWIPWQRFTATNRPGDTGPGCNG